MYWIAVVSDELPDHWPHQYATDYDEDHPMHITLNGEQASLYIASPNVFCSEGRTRDAISDILY